MKNSRVLPKNWKLYIKLILFALASIIIGILSFFGIEWWFIKFFQYVSKPLDWNLLGGFTSMISLALVAGGLAFAGAEYVSKENAKAQEKAKLSYDIYQAIFDKLTAPEQEAARRWILTSIDVKKDDEDIAAWYQKTHVKIMERQPGDEKSLPEGHTAVKLTLNCFDYIGFIADHYWEIDNDSLDWISPPVAKVWKMLGPYVTYIRSDVKKVNDYYVSAENFGQRCIKWRQEKGLPDEVIIRDAPQV